MRSIALSVSLSLLACSSTTTSASPESTSPAASTTTSSGGAAGTPPSANTPGLLPGASSVDAPEISRSAGVPNGVVVFWPRVSPRSEDPAMRTIAANVQGRLRTLVERTLPGRAVDVRPEPERVCPRAGCNAMTVGFSLYHSNSGACSVVALVSGAGASPARLVPWAGRVQLREETVPFREPPEARILVEDAVPCAGLGDALTAGEAAVAEAIRTAAGR